MNLTKFLRITSVFTIFACLIFAIACVQAPEQNSVNTAQESKTAKIRIGFLMDSLKQERWQKDRDAFVRRGCLKGTAEGETPAPVTAAPAESRGGDRGGRGGDRRRRQRR